MGIEATYRLRQHVLVLQYYDDELSYLEYQTARVNMARDLARIRNSRLASWLVAYAADANPSEVFDLLANDELWMKEGEEFLSELTLFAQNEGWCILFYKLWIRAFRMGMISIADPERLYLECHPDASIPYWSPNYTEDEDIY